MKKLNLFVTALIFCLIGTNTVSALSLNDLGELLWNKLSQAIGILFIMFAIIIGVGKIWERTWNIAIKCTMVLVVFITEVACICVMPVVGVNARELFGNMI